MHEFFLFVKASLRVLYIRYSPVITYVCIYISTLPGLVLAKPSQNKLICHYVLSVDVV